MARPCLICADSRKAAKAAELIAAGHSDQTVAHALNAMTPAAPPMSFMAVNRHRRNHIVAPAKALAEAAGKGRDVAEQRAQVMAAAQAGDPMAFVALQAIVDDLRKVHDRLERQAEAADAANERTMVSALSAQQLRSMEVRSKIGGVGGYATPKTADIGGPVVQFTIMHSSGAPSISIAATPVEPSAFPDADERANPFTVLAGIRPAREVIEALPDGPDEDGDFDEDV